MNYSHNTMICADCQNLPLCRYDFSLALFCVVLCCVVCLWLLFGGFSLWFTAELIMGSYICVVIMGIANKTNIKNILLTHKYWECARSLARACSPARTLKKIFESFFNFGFHTLRCFDEHLRNIFDKLIAIHFVRSLWMGLGIDHFPLCACPFGISAVCVCVCVYIAHRQCCILPI